MKAMSRQIRAKSQRFTVAFVTTLVVFLCGVNAFAFDVTIDATALTTRSFDIAGVTGTLDTATVQTVSLVSGNYSFRDASVFGNFFNFTIDVGGRFAYDPSFEDFLDGAGTPNLVVRGFLVSVDATALTTPTFDIPGITGLLATATVHSFIVIPATGGYGFRSGFVIPFFVGHGIFDYDTFFDNVLLGRGTSRLVVLGDPGAPPSCAQRVQSLRDAVDATDAPGEVGLLRILDQLASAIAVGATNRAFLLLNAFENAVNGFVKGGQIDPIIGQLLIARAQLIRAFCL